MFDEFIDYKDDIDYEEAMSASYSDFLEMLEEKEMTAEEYHKSKQTMMQLLGISESIFL